MPRLPLDSPSAGLSHSFVSNWLKMVLCTNIFILSLYGLLGQTFKVETTLFNFE